MSHFTVMVIGNNPEKQLQPYHEYECTGIEDEFVVLVEAEEDIEAEYKEHKGEYDTIDEFAAEYYGYKKENGKYGRYTNPNAKWDWYVLGGRWSNNLLLKNGRYADAALKGEIDFEKKEQLAAKEAGEEWDKVHNVIKNYPEADSWEYLRDDKHKGEIEVARKAYREQPQVKAFQNIKTGFFDSLEDYKISREDYVINAALKSYSTFAMVKDGQWHEKGQMGWFGMSSNEMPQNEWDKFIRDTIAALPDNTLISIYDCHI